MTTDEAKASLGEEAALRDETRAIENPLQRLCIDRKARDPLILKVQRVFMHLFTKMTGRRDARRQSAFRKATIAAYNAINPEQNNESLWCPITQAYWPKAAVEAAHIFPCNHGQFLMD